MPNVNLELPQILLLGVACTLIVLIAVWGFHLLTADNQVSAELETTTKKKPEEIFILHRVTELIGLPFRGTTVKLLGDGMMRKIRGRIDTAGRPEGLTAERYAQRKAGEIVLYGGLMLLFVLSGQTFFGIIMLLGAVLTDLDLYSRRQKRMDQIQRQLPDFLDVLAVTVGAGLSFRQAIERVSASMPGVLAEEFRLVLQQMDLGTPRKEAFEQLRVRNRNDSLGKFVTAIQQAEELGAPLSQALMEISLDMRRDDAQYMRRLAQKINPRVTLVSTATLLPGLMLLLGGSMFFGLDIDWSTITGGM
ncbi:tight adherence protein C [Murinocardiopsis flavida]|uniref:Tight adherence protein C n=1 Tax=Murinocardiopsis flavida TaxID=645275 RepID=A0A2P8D268_9ACTN|nr:type II secretion system F family protein [Murinocardiopsis flavida]PSK91314.1 tight adherence protein C [Murinocardiopsis flavida]